MTTDRDALSDLAGSVEAWIQARDAEGEDEVADALRDPLERALAHFAETDEHDCSREVERASRAAYAAGQAAGAGAAPAEGPPRSPE